MLIISRNPAGVGEKHSLFTQGSCPLRAGATPGWRPLPLWGKARDTQGVLKFSGDSPFQYW